MIASSTLDEYLHIIYNRITSNCSHPNNEIDRFNAIARPPTARLERGRGLVIDASLTSSSPSSEPALGWNLQLLSICGGGGVAIYSDDEEYDSIKNNELSENKLSNSDMVYSDDKAE